MVEVGDGVVTGTVERGRTWGVGTGDGVPRERAKAVRGMSAPGFPVAEGEESVRPSGLLDVLGVASVVLDAEGRIVLWSPQAEELFGYPAQEALGQFAARIMVHEQHLDLVVKLFADVMVTGQSWAGAFP